jgi:long-subunit acyl-CoA synthetase (AMP-forming)
LDGFAIKDLYAKHPTKLDRWLYKGRADDLIVLSNGEKLNPLDMEACINEHPAVKASLIVRSKCRSRVALIDIKTGRTRQIPTAAIAQLRDPLPATAQEIQSIKGSICLNIAAANVQALAHGQIHKGYIIFASDDKPFILAGKETVLRAMIVKLYESKINDLFAKRELLRTSEVQSIDMQSLESTREGIHNLICEILGLKTLGGNDDILLLVLTRCPFSRY